MKKTNIKLLAAGILSVSAFGAIACQDDAKLKSVDEVKTNIESHFDNLKVSSLELLPGSTSLYAIDAGESGKALATADGKYVIVAKKGYNVIDISGKDAFSLTAKKSQANVAAVMSKLIKGPTAYPEGDIKGTIKVFTDVNCPVCKTFDKEVPKYLEAGYAVEYHAFPFKKGSMEAMRKIWCAKDPIKAIHKAKQEGSDDFELVDNRGMCDIVYDNDIASAKALGLTGTPTIIFSDNEILRGYLPAEKVIEMQDKKIIKNKVNQIQEMDLPLDGMPPKPSEAPNQK